MTDERIPANSIYSVAPWGDRYVAGTARRRGNTSAYASCAICGRALPGDRPALYGGIITTEGEWTTDPNHPDSQGWHPVGSECHRRFVVRGEVKVVR